MELRQAIYERRAVREFTPEIRVRRNVRAGCNLARIRRRGHERIIVNSILNLVKAFKE